MQSALPLSIIIAVAAFAFVAAYLLAQFIAGRIPRAEANTGAATTGGSLEPRQTPKLPAPRYRRRHESGGATSRGAAQRRAPTSYARASGKRSARAAGKGRDKPLGAQKV